MRFALPIVIVALLVAAAPATAASDSCVPKGNAKRGKLVKQARASKVVNRYALDAMEACDGVEGMGVGARDTAPHPDPSEKVFLVVVYLRDAASKPAGARSISGVRIRYVVTGKFQAQ